MRHSIFIDQVHAGSLAIPTLRSRDFTDCSKSG